MNQYQYTYHVRSLTRQGTSHCLRYTMYKVRYVFSLCKAVTHLTNHNWEILRTQILVTFTVSPDDLKNKEFELILQTSTKHGKNFYLKPAAPVMDKDNVYYSNRPITFYGLSVPNVFTQMFKQHFFYDFCNIMQWGKKCYMSVSTGDQLMVITIYERSRFSEKKT